MIQNVEIRNFKSIKELSFSAKRVNVFVGKPNVGKSNILEALSLFCIGYLNSYEKIFSPFIRMNYVQELFHKKDIKNEIFVGTNIGDAILRFHALDSYYLLIDPNQAVRNKNVNFSDKRILGDIKQVFYDYYKTLNDKYFGELTPFFASFNNEITRGNEDAFRGDYYSPIKKYLFNGISAKPTALYYSHSLTVPDGKNIVTILYEHRELLNFFAQILKDEYDLDLVVKSPENILEVQTKDGMITNSTSINLIADTLQRLMFYLTAIKSNKGSMLLLEEPETHSFPTYTNLLADNIARDVDNQYFITTHSPYLLSTLLDKTPINQISVYVTRYKNYETSLHQLSTKEITELLDYDIDLFYNFKKFID